MMDIDGLLKGQRSTIEKILQISKTPGLSLGVLKDGEIVHEAYFGYRDVEKKIRPDGNTRYNINSLTKAILSASCSILIQEGKLKWDSRLSEFFSEFASDAIENHITVADLLSHRSGYLTPEPLWLQDQNIVLLKKHDAIPVFLRYNNGAHDRFRIQCIYNNYGYSVVGLLIEKLSGQELGDFLDERIFKPLGMTRTTTLQRDADNPDDNTAKAYAVLEDGSWCEISLVEYMGRDTLMEAAGGVKSSIHDLMLFYTKMMEELHLGPHEDLKRVPNLLPDGVLSPLKDAKQLIEPRSFFDTTSVREETYALGWIRTELPAQLGKLGTNARLVGLPFIGEDAPSTLCIYHQGLQAGSSTSVYTLPEHNIAIVALQNSSSACDCADWVAQLCIQTIFDHPSKIDYAGLATEGTRKFLDLMPSIHRELESNRTKGTTPSLQIADYVGHYYDPSERFYIDVRLGDSTTHDGEDGTKRELELAFQGLDSQKHKLRHYENDTFSWALTHNEASRSGRLFAAYDAGFYLMQFLIKENDQVFGLHWAINIERQDDPVLFLKKRA